MSAAEHLEQLIADLDRRITALEESLDVKTTEPEDEPWT